MSFAKSKCTNFCYLLSVSHFWGKLLDTINLPSNFVLIEGVPIFCCHVTLSLLAKDLTFDYDPEAQPPIEKGPWEFSYLFSENVELIFQWCLKHTNNTEEMGGIHWFQGLFFSLLVWIVSSILYNKLLVLVPSIKRTGFRSTSLSIVPLS